MSSACRALWLLPQFHSYRSAFFSSAHQIVDEAIPRHTASIGHSIHDFIEQQLARKGLGASLERYRGPMYPRAG
jgi:hypothetical protein